MAVSLFKETKKRIVSTASARKITEISTCRAKEKAWAVHQKIDGSVSAHALHVKIKFVRHKSFYESPV